jgi:hypothetical protein
MRAVTAEIGFIQLCSVLDIQQRYVVLRADITCHNTVAGSH